MVSPFMADADKLAAVRAALPSLAAGIQLNTAVAGPLPDEVAAAMDQIARYEREVGRADPGHVEESAQRVEEARAAIAAIVGGDLDEVLLSHGPAEAIDRVVGAIAGATDDRVVTVDDAVAIGPDDASVRIPVEADDDEVMAAFRVGLRPAPALVIVPQVMATTGRVLPVARIAGLAHERGARVVIDGSMAAGAIPVAVHEMGADAYVVAGSRWLLGPEGIGGLWVSPEVRPSIPGWSDWHAPSVVGLARAIGWLSMFVGLDFVHRRGQATARRAAERLAAVAGVRLVTPLDRMAAIVTFRIAGWDPAAALEELAARTFAIATALPSLAALRISPGFWTTDDEIDRFVDGVALLAGHGPGALPPRRTLAILGSA